MHNKKAQRTKTQQQTHNNKLRYVRRHCSGNKNSTATTIHNKHEHTTILNIQKRQSVAISKNKDSTFKPRQERRQKNAQAQHKQQEQKTSKIHIIGGMFRVQIPTKHHITNTQHDQTQQKQNSQQQNTHNKQKQQRQKPKHWNITTTTKQNRTNATITKRNNNTNKQQQRQQTSQQQLITTTTTKTPTPKHNSNITHKYKQHSNKQHAL